MDYSGKAIKFTDLGFLRYSWQFNQTVCDMTLSDNTIPYIAFNLGNRIEEYYLSSGTLSKIYYPQNGT